LFCNPEGERACLVSHAIKTTLGIAPVCLPWTRVIRGDLPWDQLGKGDFVFRLESPGKNWLVEKEFLKVGAGEADEEDGPWRRLTPEEAAAIKLNAERVWPMRTWFLGWRRVLKRLEAEAGRQARWMNPPSNAIAMFDKAESDRRIAAVGAGVPESLGIPVCFDDLVARMNAARRWRVFLKPCHGSSASGVVALEICGDKIQAWSTLELVTKDGQLYLFNNRRVRIYRGAKEVRALVEAVCRERSIAQVWWPKAGWRGKRFDLRVVVIDGRACHVVPRLSASPFTNLQLGAERGDPEQLRCEVGEENWARMLAECERAATAFPGNLYCAFDVLVSPCWRRFAIAEANAFGDLLRVCVHEGKDAYTAELQAYMHRES
jgi:glutathione synthase/RimK-type ligase-like ATP-grasp enzyme